MMLFTHQDAGKIKGTIEHLLSKVVVVLYQGGGVSVQPVHKDVGSCHDSSCHFQPTEGSCLDVVW